jgi:hypothetical protein
MLSVEDGPVELGGDHISHAGFIGSLPFHNGSWEAFREKGFTVSPARSE